MLIGLQEETHWAGGETANSAHGGWQSASVSAVETPPLRDALMRRMRDALLTSRLASMMPQLPDLAMGMEMDSGRRTQPAYCRREHQWEGEEMTSGTK
jgi:hypothetical protein